MSRRRHGPLSTGTGHRIGSSFLAAPGRGACFDHAGIDPPKAPAEKSRRERPAENGAGMRSDVLSIQYLRGLAALGVLLFHASQRAGGACGAGAAGVDVFFVISGFIMWTVSARRATGPGDFLLRRAGRIAPLYWAVTLLVVGLDLLRPSLFPNMRLNAPHVILSLLFLPHRDP